MKQKPVYPIKINSFLHWYHDGNYYTDIAYDQDSNILRISEYECSPTVLYEHRGWLLKWWMRRINREGWLQDLFYVKTMELLFVKKKICTYAGYLNNCQHEGIYTLNAVNSNKLYARKEVTLGIVCKQPASDEKGLAWSWFDSKKFQLDVDLKGGLILNGAYLKHTESRKLSK